MSVKLHHQSFVSSSSSNPWFSRKPTRTHFFNKRIVDYDHLLFSCGYSRKRCCVKPSLLKDGNLSLSCRLVDFKIHCLTFRKSIRMEHLLPFASADDRATVDGSPQASTSSDVGEMRVKLDQSLQGEDYNTGLVQTLHDAARVFELAIKEHSSLSKISWFSTAWLGADKNAWMKALSYQELRFRPEGKEETEISMFCPEKKQLQRAIDREKIWSRLATCESIEVLERDLAIFGFFIALGRRTQSFLYASGFEAVDEPTEGFIRYLIGGSVLYYPQLASISSYQLYVEVVCEELEWLPFYPGNIDTSKRSHGHRSKRDGPPDAEAIPLVLDVCSHWIQSFIKYSTWLENPSNVKAARFLSRGHTKLRVHGRTGDTKEWKEANTWNQMIENTAGVSVLRTGSGTYVLSEKEPDFFDKRWLLEVEWRQLGQLCSGVT